MTEFTATSLLLATFGLLLVLGVSLSRAVERLGFPIALLFLVLGMLAGSEGVGGVAFDDYRFAFQVGTMALVLILFDGGLNTSLRSVREAAAPAALLATAGVLITAAIVALGARLAGLDWKSALLLGAVVSSTDAATVFAVFRAGGFGLRRKISTTLELESGLNDPAAVILTVTLTQIAIGPSTLGWSLALIIPLQLAIGAALGVATGYASRWLLTRIRVSAGGLFPVITVGLALLTFGITTAANGSGFLAVYAMAVVLGNGPIPYKPGLRRIHDALAWVCQVSMFLMLGLLVFPSMLPAVALPGILLGLLLALVARPVAVVLCLLPFRFKRAETAFVAWAGLRGAVPIILACYPVLAGHPHGAELFNLVFFIVVVNAIVPGATLRWVSRRLGLFEHARPTPSAVLEINATSILAGRLLAFRISPQVAVCGAKISEIEFPPEAAVLLVVRDKRILAARGATVLNEGDRVHLFCRDEDVPFVTLLFGQPEDENS